MAEFLEKLEEWKKEELNSEEAATPSGGIGYCFGIERKYQGYKELYERGYETPENLLNRCGTAWTGVMPFQSNPEKDLGPEMAKLYYERVKIECI